MQTEKNNHWIILLLENDERDYTLIRDALYDIEDYQITFHWMRNADEAINTLCEGKYHAALVKHHLYAHHGLDFISATASRCTETPMV